MKVLVLGAGFGGLELTSRLADEFGDQLDIVLIDQSDAFVFGFSKLDVIFGRTTAAAVRHPYRDIVKPGVRFVRARVELIDPAARRVDTDAGTFTADVMVVALGADLHPSLTPGLVECGHEFYTVSGAFALRDVLAGFEGGQVVVGVTSTPFKCPPAPSEMALLVEAYLGERGLRDRSSVSLVMPMGVPIPPSPGASELLLSTFAQRGIDWYPDRLVRSLDGDRVVLEDGNELGCDLFLGVPMHRAPDVVVSSGLTVDGWIPVDPLTMQTAYPDVFAVGDVTSVGTPKAGVFAEGQAAVVASRIGDIVRGDTPSAEYDGRGICYLEFGHDEVAKVDVTFRAGARPVGDLDGPSADLARDKTEFGSDRVRRWFGRTWPSAPPDESMHAEVAGE